MNRERQSVMLNAIVELDNMDREKHQAIFEEAKRKYGDRNELTEEYQVSTGYSKKMHTGKIKEEYLDITPLELSMILDNGFSHFGGSASISTDGSFTVIIYTD